MKYYPSNFQNTHSDILAFEMFELQQIGSVYMDQDQESFNKTIETNSESEIASLLTNIPFLFVRTVHHNDIDANSLVYYGSGSTPTVRHPFPINMTLQVEVAIPDTSKTIAECIKQIEKSLRNQKASASPNLMNMVYLPFAIHEGRVLFQALLSHDSLMKNIYHTLASGSFTSSTLPVAMHEDTIEWNERVKKNINKVSDTKQISLELTSDMKREVDDTGLPIIRFKNYA